jgi:hypothetical protein
MNTQFEWMLQVARKWADKIRTGFLPRHLTWQAWRTTIQKTLEYPLVSTTLTKTQCDKLTSIVTAAALPRCPKVAAAANSTAALFTEEQVSVMMKKVMASMKERYGKKKKPKRQVQFEDEHSSSDSDSDDKNVSGNDSSYLLYTYLFDYNRTMEAPPHKRRKVEHYSAEIIVEIVDSKNNVVPIRALLDTGTSETILLKRFLAPNSPKGYKGAPVTWKTLGGNFVTHGRAKIQFAFPELSDKKSVSWVVHVDQHTQPSTAM